MCDEAVRDLQRIKEKLFSEIVKRAREVLGRGQGQRQVARLKLGCADFTFDTSSARDTIHEIRRLDESSWGVHPRNSEWHIVAFGEKKIAQSSGQNSYLRSANLVFARPHERAEYRWLEMAFWSLSRVSGQEGYPGSLRYVWEIDEALAPIVGVMNLAYQPVPIDGENEEAFVEYWMGIVAQAAMGRLSRPMQMPMQR